MKFSDVKWVMASLELVFFGMDWFLPLDLITFNNICKLCLQHSASLHPAAMVMEDTTRVFCAFERGMKIRGVTEQCHA